MKHFIFGGRFGDICHSIPAVYEYVMRTGNKARFTAAAEFASILQGCSYIESYAAPVPWAKINEILRYARQKFPDDEFVNMACYGHDYAPPYHSYSFLRESWALSGCPVPAERVPLIFDQRNKVSEANLLANHTNNLSKPFILVCTNGRSSPFPYSNRLLEDVRLARPDCCIVDISQARSERVYDLIALFEKAVALVTIDTLHLHLSAAVPSLPVFAFICSGPTRWNRSDWRPQQVWRCTYGEYEDKRIAFKAALQTMNSTPKIYHVWSHIGPRSEDAQRRMRVAQESWRMEAEWAGNWDIYEQTARDFSRLHDDCTLPYIRDVINAAVSRTKSENDIISISNSDVGLVQGITSQILDRVRENGCAFSHRNDICGARIEKPIFSEAEVTQRCSWYPGSDWFVFSVAWWKKHGHELPDMVVGREYWDCVFRQIIKKYGGQEIHKAVWHEKHASFWEQPGNRENLAGNKHNRKLAMQFFVDNRSNDQDPFRNTWNIQPGVTQRIDPKGANSAERKQLHKTPHLVFPRRLEYHQNTARRIRQ